jgi:TPP-dependent pyruvate/acetoin dehydrogenase alpha subunit
VRRNRWQPAHLRPGFKSNGVQGGIVPAAAGIALARKLGESDGLSVVFRGDGTLDEGLVCETLNLAARRLPLLIVLEVNEWSQSTPSSMNLAGDIGARFTAFGLPVVEVDTTDVLHWRCPTSHRCSTRWTACSWSRG